MNKAHKIAYLQTCMNMRYIGDGDLLEYGKIYSHCIIKFTTINRSVLRNIEVLTTYSEEELTPMQILYSSYADMLVKWELIG